VYAVPAIPAGSESDTGNANGAVDRERVAAARAVPNGIDTVTCTANVPGLVAAGKPEMVPLPGRCSTPWQPVADHA